MKKATVTTPKLSATEKMLAAIENKPTKSIRGMRFVKTARRQAEIAAKALAEHQRCSLDPVLSARAALAQAEDSAAPVLEVATARREVDKLVSTFAKVCVMSRPKGR